MLIAGKGVVNLDKVVSISSKDTSINIYYTDGYYGTLTFDTLEEVDSQLEEIRDYLEYIGEIK
jgi:DNA-binding LytR/AlgR family response regulator